MFQSLHLTTHIREFAKLNNKVTCKPYFGKQPFQKQTNQVYNDYNTLHSTVISKAYLRTSSDKIKSSIAQLASTPISIILKNTIDKVIKIYLPIPYKTKDHISLTTLWIRVRPVQNVYKTPSVLPVLDSRQQVGMNIVNKKLAGVTIKSAMNNTF